MNEDERAKIEMILHECDVHAGRVEYAQNACSRLFPLTGQTYGKLSNEEIAHIDQLIYRYMKLQDALGAKLFPAIVAQFREDAESLTILDKLNQLERLNAIADAERWQELRELRNQLSHDYQDHVETAVGYLNDVYETSSILLGYYKQATRFVREQIISPDQDS